MGALDGAFIVALPYKTSISPLTMRKKRERGKKKDYSAFLCMCVRVLFNYTFYLLLWSFLYTRAQHDSAILAC